MGGFKQKIQDCVRAFRTSRKKVPVPFEENGTTILRDAAYQLPLGYLWVNSEREDRDLESIIVGMLEHPQRYSALRWRMHGESPRSTCRIYDASWQSDFIEKCQRWEGR